MERYPTFLLNAGHGGCSASAGYLTKGKRSPIGPNGVIYEGMSNRAFVHDVAYHLSREGRRVEVVSDSVLDTEIGARVSRVNKIVGGSPEDYLLIDLHSNGLHDYFGDQTGIEIWTTVGETTSDLYAAVIASDLSRRLPDYRWRKGHAGQWDKEHNFGLIRGTKCPAVLLELLFMDGEKDYEILTSISKRALLTEQLVESLLAIRRI